MSKLFVNILINDSLELKSLSFFLLKLCKNYDFFALEGNLGMGKTTFVKYLAEWLGIEGKVSSPTFNILNRYRIKGDNKFINHFDFFRFDQEENFDFFEEFTEGNLNFIEWASKNKNFLLKKKVAWIFFIMGKKSNERNIYLEIETNLNQDLNIENLEQLFTFFNSYSDW